MNDAVLLAMQQADAIMGVESFALTERMKALDAAVLAGRATQAEVLEFVKLDATPAGARSYRTGASTQEQTTAEPKRG